MTEERLSHHLPPDFREFSAISITGVIIHLVTCVPCQQEMQYRQEAIDTFMTKLQNKTAGQRSVKTETEA